MLHRTIQTDKLPRYPMDMLATFQVLKISYRILG